MRQATVMLIAAALIVGLGQPPFVRAAEGDTGKALGYVIKILASQLVMEEFPEDSDDVKEVTYTINGSTRFNNFDSLDDLNEFDDLEIDYKEVDGQRLALTIYRIQVFQDFSADEEMGEALPEFTDSEDI